MPIVDPLDLVVIVLCVLGFFGTVIAVGICAYIESKKEKE